MDSVEHKTSFKLLISHREEMLKHVLSCLPEEACGLVASDGQVSKAVYPITNELHSTVRFRMDPEEQFKAFMEMEKLDWVLAGIYHSHPNGPSQPSARDIAEFSYPGVCTLLWFPVGNRWHCNCFLIFGNGFQKFDHPCFDEM